MSEFSKQKGGKYGVRSKCKECRAQHYQNYKEEIAKYKKQYRQNHKKEKAKYDKQYRQEHKEEIAKYRQEHKEERANYGKQYRQEHKEEIANRQRQYYQNNKEEIINCHKQYYQNNKEERKNQKRQYHQTPLGKEAQRKANQKRRALKKQSFYQSFTQEDKEICLNYFNYKCPYTGKQLTDSEIHIDHIVALSDKDGIGATAPWNMLLCDASANHCKSNKPVLEFINSLPNADEIYNKIRGYIILQAKRYIDIIPEDDVTLKIFNITFEEIEEIIDEQSNTN